jgi:hypothetical protein
VGCKFQAFGNVADVPDVKSCGTASDREENQRLMSKRLVIIVVSVCFLTLFGEIARVPAQEQETRASSVEIVPAPTVEFPALVDSNSPAFWQFYRGQNRLHLITSWGTPSLIRGPSLRRLSEPQAVRFSNQVNGGRWMEAVIQDDAGTLYGYYHFEPLGVCGPVNKTAPRIGAARSLDDGLSWEDLGIILEVSETSLDCDTPNDFFAGGVGDLSVILDGEGIDAYLFFSSYSGDATRQGVAVARMPWAQRNSPQSSLAIWDRGTWRYPRSFAGARIRRGFEPTPIYPATISWHDRSNAVDSFWGPSVHWNTSLQQFVMLLNRASDASFNQEGIYVAFSSVLDDPTTWTQPVKILDGGAWYPQVLGLERDAGTDKLAGSIARLFLRGRSDYFLIFRR